MHGLFTPSADFFSNTTTLHKIAPSRAKTLMGTTPESRTLNPFVSFEERAVVEVSEDSEVQSKHHRCPLVIPQTKKDSKAKKTIQVISVTPTPPLLCLPGVLLCGRLL